MSRPSRTRTHIHTHTRNTVLIEKRAHQEHRRYNKQVFGVLFFFSPFPRKRVSHSHLVKYMYYQSRNSLPYFASALVAFFFKFLFALHSFKSHYIYDKRENNKGVFFSSAGQKVSSARVNLRWYTRRCTSFQRPCPPSLPRKFSFTCTTYKYTYIEKTMQRCVYFVYSVGCLIHRSTFHYPFTYRKTEVENVSENVQRLV